MLWTRVQRDNPSNKWQVLIPGIDPGRAQIFDKDGKRMTIFSCTKQAVIEVFQVDFLIDGANISTPVKVKPKQTIPIEGVDN